LKLTEGGRGWVSERINTVNKKIYLITICLISTLGGFLFGYDTAVISGTLSFVKTQFEMSNMMEGWFVGSALLGCIIGVAFAGIIADRFGRKKTLILSALLLLISAFGCMLAQNLTILISYRLIGGLGVGIASMLSPLYISEISWPEIRGRMVSLYQFAITIGILVAYFANSKILTYGESLGNDTDGLWIRLLQTEVWRGMFGSEALPGIVFLILLFFVPESPRWLMVRNREKEALKILNLVTGEEEAQKEIMEIKKTLSMETASWKQLLAPGIKAQF